MDLLWRALVEAVALIARADGELLRIAALSMAVSLAATALAALAGVPLGVCLGLGRFPGRIPLHVLVNAGMGMPPVVVGLTLMILLWRTGPFGTLQLLYTPAAMLLAQFIVAAPVVIGLTRSAMAQLDPGLVQALRVDGAGRLVLAEQVVRAALPQVITAVAAAFGRAIAEVGASLMVGGNIAGETRTLTTAVTLHASRGEFALALALGLILLAAALLVNAALAIPERRRSG